MIEVGEERFTQRFIRLPIFELTDSSDYDFNRQMQLIADRYVAEDRLLTAVASGDEEAVFTASRESD